MLMRNVLLACFFTTNFAASLSSSPIAGAIYNVNLSSLGPSYAGVGAQSTAGTSRLLIDYPLGQRASVLDFLFKPQFGASLQHFKVEIGGDAQISCGAEASGQRTANSSEVNWEVGYEGWLMAEAKARNPDIEFLGLVYAWPSWVNPSGKYASPFETPETEGNAALYMTNWVRGMRDVYNVSIHWVGLWNEREYTVSYVLTLRDALDAAGFADTKILSSDRFWDPISTDYMASAALRNATGALAAHGSNCGVDGTGQYGPCSHPNTIAAHQEYGVPLYSTEDFTCWADDNAAVYWMSKLNSNFIGGNVTFFSAWYMITAYYPSYAFWNEGLMRATQPWSGHFVLSPSLWATAHYTQFTQLHGWRYIKQGQGSGALEGGGTYVTLVDALGNITMVIEAASDGGLKDWSSHNCNSGGLGLNYRPVADVQNATFVFTGAVIPQSLALWRSRFLRGNRNASSIFERLPDVLVNKAGLISLAVEPDAVYTLSTFPGASKQEPAIVPPSTPFPLPYADDFEGLPVGRPGQCACTRLRTHTQLNYP